MNENRDSKKIKVSDDNLGTSLVQSITKSGASDIATEVAEIALDSFLDEGLLEEIPVFGWLKKSHNIIGSIRDRIFFKKIANFLIGTQSILAEEREQFSKKLDNDLEFLKKVGETLVLLLERQDDFEKALILGKIFSRYVRGHIEYEVFLKLAKTVEISFIGELKNLDKYYKKIQSYDSKKGKPFSDWLDDTTSQSLYISGLIRSEGYTESIFHPNKLGEELLRCLVTIQQPVPTAT